MSFSSEDLIRRYQARTGLPERQVLLLVARCGLVRHLADHHHDRFILKGGGLLYHVYNTNRASFVDTDFADVETAVPDPEEIRTLLTIESPDGFSLSTTPDGRWKESGYILQGERLTFSVDALTIRPGSARHVKVSVSFRRGECLDKPQRDLYFDAGGLLTERNVFRVNGLTLDEVAAEKVLAWCLKPDLSKHFADLALLARKWRELDGDRVLELIARKFDTERDAPETRSLYASGEFRSPADLVPVFLDPGRLAAMRRTWSSKVGSEIWLRAEERSEARTIAEFVNVESLVRERWEPLLARLAE